VNQREVGVDTVSFSQALKSALRQDPDVILVGEMRDLETIETALTAAETGHLVMSTLHTLDATETINRIVSVFPPYQQKQVRLQLGSVLKAVISQRLVPRADGKGRVAAVEVLKNTARVRELIEDKDRTKEIPDAIAQGHQSYGTQTFDQSLMSLVRQKIISYEEAHRQASNPDDFALRFSGISATSDARWDDFDGTQDGNSAPGSLAFAQRGAPTASPGPATTAPAPRAPAAPGGAPGTPLGRINPGAPRPGGATPAAKPASGGASGSGLPAADDDFHIERF
jgi:twitching motility protein PilT